MITETTFLGWTLCVALSTVSLERVTVRQSGPDPNPDPQLRTAKAKHRRSGC